MGRLATVAREAVERILQAAAGTVVVERRERTVTDPETGLTATE